MSKYKIICKQCGFTWESDTKTPDECPECLKDPLIKPENKNKKPNLTERLSKLKKGEG